MNKNKQTTKLSAFTLIEVMIGVAIIGLLMVILFQTYVTIMRISVRIELERTAQTELLYASQVIQNLVDQYPLESASATTVVFDKSSGGGSDTLTISLENSSTSPAATGCDNLDDKLPDNPCRIIVEETNGTNISKTYLTSELVHIANLEFLPIDNSGSNVDLIYNKGFWINADIMVNRYNSNNRSTNVRTSLQTFYNSRAS